MGSFGLSENDFKLIKEIVIDPLKLAGAEVCVFGSRVTGKHHPFSDIDILYAFSSDELKMKAGISAIKEAAENSRITIKVDLVDINELAKSYRDRVLAERVRI